MSKIEFSSNLINANCSDCPLKGNKIVWGQGNYKNKIIFIGEAPGAEEEKLGKPFVGRSGKLLDKTLKEAGLNREFFYVTNIIKCRPPNNRTPTEQEKSYCSNFLRYEICKIKPKLLIPLGSTAIRNFLPNSKSMRLTTGRLFRTNVDLYSYLIFPLYHPSFILRNGISKDEYLNLFLKLKKVIYKIYLKQYKRSKWLLAEISKK